MALLRLDLEGHTNSNGLQNSSFLLKRSCRSLPFPLFALHESRWWQQENMPGPTIEAAADG